MTERQIKFMDAVLGSSGASALSKAASRSPILEQAILPRVILSWMKIVNGYGDTFNYGGSIPGTDIALNLNKTEKGWTGKIGNCELNDASLFKVCAAATIAIGVDKEYNINLIKSLDIEKLGRSIDLLLKTKIIKEKLAKKEKVNESREEDNVSGERTPGPSKGTGSSDEESKESEDKAGNEEVALDKAEIEGGAISKPAVHATRQANAGKISHDQAAQAHLTAHKAHMKAGNIKIAQHHFEYHIKHNNAHAKAKPAPAGTSGAQAMNGKEHKGAWPSGTSSWAAKSEDSLQKLETPAGAAAPVAPQAPIETNQSPAAKPAAKPAVAQAPKLPKPGATVNLTRSEMSAACPMCAGKQFNGDEFVGCTCFSDLAKSVNVLYKDELGVVIHVNEDMETIVTLLESMGRR